MNRTKLFCVPFAGGSASVYMKWKAHLHPMIELVPIELAGRGSRLYESGYQSFDDCIEDVFSQILNHGVDTPYTIFGHSMGATISFEVTRRLVAESHSNPARLFLSGRRSPQSARPTKQMHLMPEAEFITELRKLGGTAEEIFEDQNLLDIFLPIIRADYQMLSSYVFKSPVLPISVPFTVLNGISDDLYPQEISGWQAFTAHQCEYLFFEGGHFYIEQKYQEIGAHILTTMNSFQKMGVQ